MNNNSNGSNKAKEEERLIWRKRLEEVLQHVRFDEVRIRKTERIETFEMQLGRRMASSGFRLSDQFDFSDEYVLWDLQKDQPASQNDQGRGISFEWEKEWLSTERLGQQYSEIWGILKTKTYSHGTMAAMNVGDILDSYGRVYRKQLFNLTFFTGH